MYKENQDDRLRNFSSIVEFSSNYLSSMNPEEDRILRHLGSEELRGTVGDCGQTVVAGLGEDHIAAAGRGVVDKGHPVHTGAQASAFL